MAKVILTFKIMPESVEVDIDELGERINSHIQDFSGGETKLETEPVAFGLKALKIVFVMDESQGSTDKLEEDIQNMEGVQSVEVIDVRRALG